jgi:hypothetical protein
LFPLVGRWLRSRFDPLQDLEDPRVVRDILRVVVDPQDEDATSRSGDVAVAEIPAEQLRVGRLVER